VITAAGFYKMESDHVDRTSPNQVS